MNHMNMVPNDYQIWNTAESYLAGTLSETELKDLQHQLDTNPSFNTEFRECLDMLRSLKKSGQQTRLRNTLKEIQANSSEQKTQKTRTIPFSYYLRTAAVAAGVAILASFGTYFGMNHTDKKASSQYNVLRRELENIKRSQSQIIKDINTKSAQPVSNVKYTGTGFAINNKGYFVTNYHVTEGADSVYIQNHEGDYFKAVVVAYEPKTDIAILKVEDEDFRFGKGDVPYTFAAYKAGLGSRVYTVGFPEDEIVYNEGYISAKNGFENDSMQYRLELPADPGQSGAPVLDAKGNILAIVTARGNQSEGNTYAVSSKALLQLIHSLHGNINLRVPKVNRLGNLSREKQLEKLEYYTCSVKVYKK